MKPFQAIVLGSWTLWLAGCNSPSIRSQSPEGTDAAAVDVPLVGDLASPVGMFPVRIEAIGLVTGLAGTGSDPAPSPERAALLAEMQARGVAYPNRVLESPNTALVKVRAYLRPGIQKGDPLDVEVRIPSNSDTTSLRNGWLMQTRLKELAVLDGRVRSGDSLALAEGPVLVDPVSDSSDRVSPGRGRVLGGGRATESRVVGLVLKGNHRHVVNSARIGTALNRRFHTFTRGVKEGVATPKDDRNIELRVHPRYKDNIERYMLVVRNVPVRETPAERVERLRLLGRQLLDPISAASAALKLEALGKDGIEILQRGLTADEREVRFYSAEALAYLDDARAAPVLAEAARNEPAFRVFALTALSAMDDFAAYESLRGLLHVPSVETRYGAFRALWAMNESDPVIRGEKLGDQFYYHLLDTDGPPLVHLTRSHRPELVLFGPEQRLVGPFSLEAGAHILVTAREGSDEVTVSRFSVDESDQKRQVGLRLDDVIRAIVELGGAYPDVVEALQQAKSTGALTSRLAVDALPEAGRSYRRGPDAEEKQAPEGPSAETDDEAEPAPATSEEEAPSELIVSNPRPGLYGGPVPSEDRRVREHKRRAGEPVAEKPSGIRSWFAKLPGLSGT